VASNRARQVVRSKTTSSRKGSGHDTEELPEGVFRGVREVSPEEYSAIMEKLRQADDGDLMRVSRYPSDDRFVIETRQWLDALDVKDADTRMDVFTIEQRLNWLCDPRTSHESYGRYMAECRAARMAIMMRHTLPSAVHGEKMEMGRKPGTEGPIRNLIRQVLRRHLPRNLQNLALFDEVAKRPPRGWRAANLPRRFIGPLGAGMIWRTFCNVASQERKKLGLGKKRKRAKK
jgi:hypothetical protein